jgi:hypothetical protein
MSLLPLAVSTFFAAEFQLFELVLFQAQELAAFPAMLSAPLSTKPGQR